MKNSKYFQLFITLLFLLLINVNSKCTDKPECFKKGMFNFNFPQMNIFPISGTKDNLKNYQIKAYGDFNNDLYTDYIALNQNGQIQVYVWNKTISLFNKVYESKDIRIDCEVQTIYLYDLNQDGFLDITIWGSNQNLGENQYNVLIPLVRQSESDPNQYIFKKAFLQKVQKTSNPILITNKFSTIYDGVALLLFLNGSRTFLKYQNFSNPHYANISWNDLTIGGQIYASKSFSDPHWNIFMDFTGDCLPDMMLYNSQKTLQLWINQGKKFSLNKQMGNLEGNLKGFTVSDINYDGSGDLILAFDTQIKIYLNQQILSRDSQFCNQKNKDFDFNPIQSTINMPTGQIIKPQSLHFADIDINGFPDLLFILINEDGTQNVVIYQNKFENQQTFTLFEKPNYNAPLMNSVKGSTIISASFIDILENGILDIIIVIKRNDQIQTQMFYNNFLCQNDYFIKGYGLLGSEVGKGSPFPAMSFYWINSIKDGFRVTYQSQMIQTSYDSLHMPYTFSGLGRANNYVQTFTVGRNGQNRFWSPIIPNSQLAVYTTNGNQEEWEIRIFSFPINQLISVIIVTTFVLSIFGLILMFFKCQTYRKKQQPLMMQLIQ